MSHYNGHKILVIQGEQVQGICCRTLYIHVDNNTILCTLFLKKNPTPNKMTTLLEKAKILKKVIKKLNKNKKTNQILNQKNNPLGPPWQWLRLCDFIARGMGPIPVGKLRSCILRGQKIKMIKIILKRKTVHLVKDFSSTDN